MHPSKLSDIAQETTNKFVPSSLAEVTASHGWLLGMDTMPSLLLVQSHVLSHPKLPHCL